MRARELRQPCGADQQHRPAPGAARSWIQRFRSASAASYSARASSSLRWALSIFSGLPLARACLSSPSRSATLFCFAHVGFALVLQAAIGAVRLGFGQRAAQAGFLAVVAVGLGLRDVVFDLTELGGAAACGRAVGCPGGTRGQQGKGGGRHERREQGTHAENSWMMKALSSSRGMPRRAMCPAQSRPRFQTMLIAQRIKVPASAAAINSAPSHRLARNRRKLRAGAECRRP